MAPDCCRFHGQPLVAPATGFPGWHGSPLVNNNEAPGSHCSGELYPVETDVRLCDELETGREVEVDMEADVLTDLSTGKKYPLKPLGDVRRSACSACFAWRGAGAVACLRGARESCGHSTITHRWRPPWPYVCAGGPRHRRWRHL
jgi:hypothetical protein